MSTSPAVSRYAVLYVDDEPMALKYFSRLFEEKFRVLTAPNAAVAYDLIKDEQNMIGVILADQRMPGGTGVELLEKARRLRPAVVRVMVTAYSDIDAAVDAVNRGAIFKYISKPWDAIQLHEILVNALKDYAVREEREALFDKKFFEIRSQFYEGRQLSLSNFLAGLNHHICNSMVAIKTFLDLTPEKLEEENINIANLQNSDYWGELYTTAIRYVDRINALIADLSYINNPEDLDLSDTIDLKCVVDIVIDQLRGHGKENRIELQNHVPADLPQITVDGPQFRRMLRLLLEDEIDNLPKDCRVVVFANIPEQIDGVRDELRIQIRDDGPSVSRERLRTLFDPFSARSDCPSQAGLNLIACCLIIHGHHGIIEADNNSDGGVTYSITIPTSPMQVGRSFRDRLFLHKIGSNEEIARNLFSQN